MGTGGDVSDWIEKRLGEGADQKQILEELKQRCREAPAWAPLPTTASVEEEEDDWPEPVPLPEGLSPVETLNTALLPEAIAPWVCDISERMQCPPDYVGIAALTALGSVLGRKIAVAPT
jgi:putative DNA primase/helicase